MLAQNVRGTSLEGPLLQAPHRQLLQHLQAVAWQQHLLRAQTPRRGVAQSRAAVRFADIVVGAVAILAILIWWLRRNRGSVAQSATTGSQTSGPRQSSVER